ncbi:MAG: response regulator, partial [Gemmatimonadetes bacterium]|nr:response regulator [Gemmatimonadota bacterium]NIQ55341.1 response regulator [Gemmatimonadota bacterium]NIU75544.1 response regulator [Gammaproteobacteria bacterium]NIX45259.1 response regulator [Gemmatimonadota bacterium]NIY09523.1 response regulator [Gemmatimonadota bacterium]
GAPVEAEGAGSETVLVVEDDAAVRSVVMRVLERRGFAVLEAPDGPEALDVLQHIHGGIDLLIADAVMPEMPGCQLIETARSRYPGLRALLISGYMADDLGSTAPYLAKPFTPSQLVRSVRAALDH